MAAPQSPTTAPATDTRRLPGPDLARGFMLLLIAMAYASVYVGAPFGADVSGEPWWDRAARFASTLLLDNRAFPMFAILFGYGVAWSVRRRRERGVSDGEIRRTLRRRAWLLLAFGAVHAALIFPGEILTSYGLALLLTGRLLFRGDRALRIALALTGVFYLLMVPVTMLGLTLVQEEAAEIPGYTTWEDWLIRVGQVPVTPLFLAVAYPLLFMVPLGYLAGRARIFEEPGVHRRLLRRGAVGGIAVSLLGALPTALIVVGAVDAGQTATGLLMGLQVLTGVIGGAGYAAFFVLAAGWLVRVVPAGARAVAAVGKRSLTCYILNSTLVAVVLHPDLVGLGARAGALGALAVAVSAWLVSVGVASWLEHAGRPGPLEQLMRRGVYGGGG